ncbi:MAG: hypothetical protein IJM69_01280, partial [Firmicutes bacterium]|nr:hypothetical protein [Bacillota bacterium]
MKKYKWVIIIIACCLMFFNKFIIPDGALGIPSVGWSALCIFFGYMAMVIGVSMTWPTLILILALVTNGIMTMNAAISGSLGHNVFWFVALSGVMLAGIEATGLLRRIAYWLLSRPFLKKSPWLFIGMLFFAALLIGSFMNVSAVCILFASITGEILTGLGQKKGDRFGELIMMGILLFTGLSYGISPIAHPVPILAIDLLADFGRVNFLQYFAIGLVLGILVILFFLFTLKFIFHLDVSLMKDFDPTSLAAKQPSKMSKREKAAGLIYLVVVALWLLPSVFSLFSEPLYKAFNSIGVVGPVAIGIVVMALVRIDGEPLLDVGKELKNSIPWNACMTMAAAMVLSSVMSNADNGITTAIAGAVQPLFIGLPAMVFVCIIAIFCNLMTDYSSDTIACMMTASMVA